MLLVAGFGTALARIPAPSLDAGLRAAGYPAVLVGALAPVLVATLAIAPAPTRLSWIVDTVGTRPRAIHAVEFGLASAASTLFAAASGLPAGVPLTAVQNALVTQLCGVVVSVAVGPTVASFFVGFGGAALLLSAPGLSNGIWRVLDMRTDQSDWVVIAAVFVLAVAVVLRAPTRTVSGARFGR